MPLYNIKNEINEAPHTYKITPTPTRNGVE